MSERSEENPDIYFDYDAYKKARRDEKSQDIQDIDTTPAESAPA